MMARGKRGERGPAADPLPEPAESWNPAPGPIPISTPSRPGPSA